MMKSMEDEVTAVNAEELEEGLTTLVRRKRPTMIWGPPGIGKSAVARQVADTLEMQFHDVRPLTLDPVDIRGIPYMAEGRTVWAPPSFLPATDSGDKHLIVLEELTAAPQSIQAAFYQLVLDRAIGEYELPEGAVVIACGNRETDGGVAHRMPTPLASRFTHLTMKAELKPFMEWALDNGIRTEVMFFLQFEGPEAFYHFDPRDKDLTFPCPRTWEAVSNLLGDEEKEYGEKTLTNSERAAIIGTIGQGVGITFCAFLNMWRQLPHPQTIVDDPLGAKLPDNQSAKVALIGALSRIADETNWDALMTFGERDDVGPELSTFFVTAATRRNEELRQSHAYIEWATRQNV